ncbi:hypothetical protein FRACYDRAFT_254739 [Fragilariopsis cylindrus CCMP1102]|uniref:Uncharacterized protein n=1 Tax=Fragilariopsis cylindrus CCMP1102 TaxID=635003 RepID=A0A1E7EKF9_9STRA|nr:hypothetical protein FRACYDRAFT_254739 [Fragilariopsis cylindrus CCMP1102]|eukprot:OEU06405.1 hypothetical protein FRACYDRAFT_254739 [Fragilariopsis cylindrus CCMP1102]
MKFTIDLLNGGMLYSLRTTPDESGALTSTCCTRTLCNPPTTFLFLRLKRKLDFAVGGMHANSHIFEQNASWKLIFGMVATENFLLRKLDFAVGGMYTNSHIFEQNAPPNPLFGIVATEDFVLLKRKLDFAVGGEQEIQV